MSFTFLREFLRDPVRLGAVAPSGRQLARQMVDAAGLDDGQVILELGAGTGPMTAEIVSRGVNAHFLALEPNPQLAAILRSRFPHVDLAESYAQALPELLAARGWGEADRVVSSLPWAIWSEALQREVLGAVLGVMKPGARLVTFGYVHSQMLPAAWAFRRLLDEHFASVRIASTAVLNLPPAYVFVCESR